MGRVLLSASALAMTAMQAHAGGIERSSQSVAILFEQGTYAEFTLGGVNPKVSGTVGGGAVSSGDMLSGYGTVSLGYKQALQDNLDLAIILDRPVGVSVNYPTGTGYPFAGSTADVDSWAVTGILRYKLPSNISIYGGLRVQTIQGDVFIPAFGNYTMTTNNDREVGYLVGVAWEKPEIAARVALTYNSAITHSFVANESFALGATTFDTTIPQSVNLEFQTGIAANTLLFGSIRWQEWSAFDITPPAFLGATGGSLSDITTNSITYNIGIGRKFNETWSGAVTASYEPAGDVPVGNLGPTDGFSSIGLAATYTHANMKITGGVRYIDIGDATTTTVGGNFRGNSGIAAGIKVAYSF